MKAESSERYTFLTAEQFAERVASPEPKVFIGSRGAVYLSEFCCAYRSDADWQIIHGQAENLEADVEEYGAGELLDYLNDSPTDVLCDGGKLSLMPNQNKLELTISFAPVRGEPVYLHFDEGFEALLATLPQVPIELLKSNARKAEGQ